MNESKLSPRKRYKQSSILSFIQEQPASKQRKCPTAVANKKTDSTSGEAEGGDQNLPSSQDSDVICLDTEAMASTSGIVPATEVAEPIADSSTQSDLPRQSQSPDLFDSDSDDMLLAAAMQESQSLENQTLAYGDSIDESQFESQASDFGTSLNQMRLFPATDHPTRKRKDNTNRHKVFIQTPTVAGQVPSPSSSFSDVWDRNHVRMPCSSQNLYPDEANAGKVKNRWNLIETALLSNISSSYDIEEAILTYNSRYKDKWRFTSLHQLINEEMTSAERGDLFKKVIPCMVQLALSLPSVVTEGVPLLRQQVRYSLTFSQQQLASLLANAFFCTYPRRNASHKNSEFYTYPSINMNGLFAPSGRNSRRDKCMVHKLKCVFHYFKQISIKMPEGCVTFQRKVVESLKPGDWSSSQANLNEALFTSRGLIEDADRTLQVDFANSMIGGGVLRTGCVQEEIQFITHPELIASCLFTERLCDNEVLVIKGAQRYASYTGYGDTFQFAGGYDDSIALDHMGRRYRHVVAMDATPFRNSKSQYSPDRVLREFNKAYCSFSSSKGPDAVSVATGNWGCGAFKGNHHFKGLMQLMVAAQCHRQLYYSVYGDANLQKDLYSFHEFCVSNSVSVGQLWELIAEYNRYIQSTTSSTNILQFIVNKLS